MELWVSALAALLTTAAFVPQALHIIRHRETKAISLVMYVAFASGVALWLVFGVLIGNWAIIISNAITLVLTLAIVGNEDPLRVGVQSPKRISLLWPHGKDDRPGPQPSRHQIEMPVLRARGPFDARRGEAEAAIRLPLLRRRLRRARGCGLGRAARAQDLAQACRLAASRSAPATHPRSALSALSARHP